MSVVKNFWLKGQSKRLAGAVIYQAMGQTRARSLASEVRNPRTLSQMTQRVKWANIVNLYRANQSWMKFAFETKKASQTDYNKFMSLNVTNSNIFLTKQIAAAGGCVVQAYQITQGSLPSIETVYDDTNSRWVTNLYLGEAFLFTSVSVARFSKALIDNNPAVREGDQLSFIRMTQLTNSDNGAPYVIVRKYEVVLSLTNNASIYDYLPQDYIESDEDVDNSSFCIKNSSQAGGFVLILSRTTGGKTYVSSQRIVVANNGAIIGAYSSQAALNAAIASYGESDEPFLTSTTALTTGNDFVPNAIIGVNKGSVRITPGQFWNLTKEDAATSLDVLLSSFAEWSTAQLEIQLISGGRESSLVLNTEDGEDTKVSFTLPAAQLLPIDACVTAVVLKLDQNNPIEASFLVPNEYTIEGLE